MSLLSNKPLLLSVVAVLAAIRFVLVPFIEWQNEKLSVLNRQEMQLIKGLELLASRESLDEELSRLRNERNSLGGDFLGNDADATSYQLRVQKLINSLLEKNNLKSRNTNWLAAVDKGSLEEHKIEVSFSGKQKDLIQFLLDVEQQKPKIAVYELSGGISGMVARRNILGNTNGKVTLAGWRALQGNG